MLALDGKLKGKSARLIAIEFFGAKRIARAWHDGAAERGFVRRRVATSLELMRGGYRELVRGRGRWRWMRAGRVRARAKARGRRARAVRNEPDLFADPGGGGAAGDGIAPRYLDTRAAAAYLGLGERTLIRLRREGGGPPWAGIGRRVIYDIADLDAWMTARKNPGGGARRG